MNASVDFLIRARFPRPLRVLIAGGGVAALEAALALRELAGDRVDTTLLTPEPTFVHRPLSVLEPFSHGGPHRSYRMTTIAGAADARLCADRLARVDAHAHIAHTEAGDALHYDVLVLAYGAVLRERFKHVRTIDDRRLDERLRGLIQDVEDGYVNRIAFLATAPIAWPLPLYELALMTKRAGHDASAELSVTIVTCERAPLAVFGATASAAVAQLLERHGVDVVTSAGCDVPEPGRVIISPGDRELDVDSVVALPALAARQIPGVPDNGWLGLIPIDRRCQVLGVEDVYAAGDATDFAVKHGSISAQQADTAAAEIAARAGLGAEPSDLEPVLRGVLLGGERPLALTARLDHYNSEVLRSEATELSASQPIVKTEARWLAPCLHELDLIAGTAG